ncbi:lamin-C-like [Bolinopsis microptera]|uniref:lamin-C-like n=1 Tax=Bolinopsis microptera TaxID=2820187 RepID=UPI0030797549
MGEGVAAGDLRLQNSSAVTDENRSVSVRSRTSTASSKLTDKSSTSSCENYIRDLRPPLTVLQPSRDAYEAYSAHGSFTPNPKRKITREQPPPAQSPLKNKYQEEMQIVEENKKLREKYQDYKNKYNNVLAQRISKESYLKLQEDYYKSLKKTEELEEVYKTSSEEVLALKQHINDLSQENNTLKKELAIKDQVSEVDKQIKEVCRELQEAMARDREKYVDQIEQFTDKYEDLAKTFTNTMSNMEQKYKEDALRRSQLHKAQIDKFHENFANLQNLVDIAKIFDSTSSDGNGSV